MDLPLRRKFKYINFAQLAEASFFKTPVWPKSQIQLNLNFDLIFFCSTFSIRVNRQNGGWGLSSFCVSEYDNTILTSIRIQETKYKKNKFLQN